MIVYRTNFNNPPMKPAVSKILAFVVLLIAAVSCKKSDNNVVTPAKSKTTLLTQASWKILSVGIDANKDGIAETDVTSSVPACQFDNTYSFKTDSTGVMDEAALKCNSTDPQTKPFTWGFKNNETILTGTFSFTNGDATIITMNETSLIVSTTEDSGSSTYNIIATMKH
jgi:hypothetical protein